MKTIILILFPLITFAQNNFIATGVGAAASAGIAVYAYKHSQSPPQEHLFRGNKANYNNAVFAHQKSTRVLYAFSGIAGAFSIIQGSIELSKLVKSRKSKIELTANSLHLYYNF